MVARFLIGALLALGSLGTFAQDMQQGKDYIELTPALATDSPGKIEVLEFFWYGCPHCYHLEPHIETWAKKLPTDVVFRRVPAIFNQNWEAAARVHYALEAMGQLERLHKPFFDAIHKDNLRYSVASQLEAWLSKNGVDPEKFSATAKSFAVESKVRRAVQLTNAFKFDGVPAITIQGRYVVAAQTNPAKQLANVDHFIEIARKSIPAPAAAAKDESKAGKKK